MDAVISRLANFDTGLLVVACLTLGLAPFAPPHLFEKIGMLARGELVRPIDIFDLFMHGAPWLLLAAHLLARGAARAP